MKIDGDVLVLLAGLIPVFILAALFFIFIYRLVFRGGIKELLFGAPIKSTVGEFEIFRDRNFINAKIKVHTLNGKPNKSIGIELVTKSFASYRTTPISLSKSEAKRLIELLEYATRHTNAT